LLKKIYQLAKIQLDKIPDEAVKVVDLAAARGAVKDKESEWEQENAGYQALRVANIDTHRDLVFWVLKEPKKSPSKQDLKPGLLGVTDAETLLYTTGEEFRHGPGKEISPTAPRGMGSVDRLQAYADEAYAINIRDLRRGKYDYDTHKDVGALDAEDIQRKRKEAQSGAVALMDPTKFAQWNRERYAEILAKRRSSPELQAIIKEFKEWVDKKLGEIDVTKFSGKGKIEVPGMTRYGRPIEIRQLMSWIGDVWQKVEYAQDLYAEMNLSGRAGDSYYKKSYESDLEKLKKDIAELKSGKVE